MSRITALLALLVVVGASEAKTQSGSIQATAVVQQPISVIGSQSLSFQNVFPGIPKTVQPSNLSQAGRFDVNGQASTPVSASFTLPSSLTHGSDNFRLGLGAAFTPLPVTRARPFPLIQWPGRAHV